MRIAVPIGELVMVHMMTGPPERSLLHRRGGDEGPDESRGAVHFEGAVGEVAMKQQRQADRPQEMRRGPQSDKHPSERDGKHE